MRSDSFLNTSHQKIQWFYDQNRLGNIDLRPSFQRRPVWTNEAKSFLVDTVLRGYPVPEIYVHSVGADKYAIVDGQQRLRTFLEYIGDRFAVTFDVQKLRPIYSDAETPWLGKRFSELEEEERDRFLRYKLIVRDLEGVSDGQIRHMFHRLNQSNIALNPQELRYSMYQDGLLQTVEDLVGREEWDHFRLFTKLQRRRMLDSEFISELVIGHLHWPQNKKEDLDHYYRQYSSDFPFENEVRSRFATTLANLVEIFPLPKMNGSRWYRKTDFYTLFLAISRGRINLEKWDVEQLRNALMDFSRLVNSADLSSEQNDSAARYKIAVEKAATDRGRRVRRENALLSFLGEDSEEMDLALDVDVTDEDDAEYDEEYADR
jgi:hypothetical protein